MNHVPLVAIGCVGAMSLAYLTGFYPLFVAVVALGVMATSAFVQISPKKKRPPSEPWYMRD